MKMFFSTFIFLVAPIQIFAATTLIISGPSSDATQAISVYLSTDSKINAIEGHIILPKNIIVHQLRIGGSLLSSWVQEPSLQDDNSIVFSGIIPGGVSGNIPLFSFDLSSGADALPMLLSQTTVYLNDGRGTSISVPVQYRNADTSVAADAFAFDMVAPEPFLVTITRDKKIQNGKFIALFSARDVGSGIAYYETQESTEDTPREGGWYRTQNPYVLSDQLFGHYVFIKAVDFDGNSRIERAHFSGRLLLDVRFLLLLLCSVLVFGGILYVRHKRRQALRGAAY